MEKIKNLAKRLSNVGTLVSVVCTIGLLINQFQPGLVDNEWLKATLDIICSLGLALGVLNDPTTPGLDNPTK